MKKLALLLSSIAVLGGMLTLSTCKKDEPNQPTITGLSPAQGSEGDVITINGTFLGSTHAIKFGTVSAQVVDPKGNQVTTQVPAGVPVGKVDVSVETDAGQSNGFSFTVIIPPPVITSINPIKGGAGMTIAITGKFFTTAKEVAFGTAKVTTFDSKSETTITLKLPDGLTLGATDVSVTSDTGTSNKVSFTVLAKPTITSFTPTSGIIGTHVLITGTALEETTNAYFGTIKVVPSPQINSATLIDVIVPVGAVTGKIRVETTGGEVVSVDDFVVKGAPVIASFTPVTGIVGTDVTITGQNFSVSAPTVKFGTTSVVSPTVNSDTEIIAKVPAGAATGKISITTTAGTGTSTNDFVLVGVPTVTGFTPIQGFIGTSVVITGTNFVNVSALKFNTTAVTAGNFTVNSATQITATVPTGATTGMISVTTPAGTGASSNAFTIVGAPTVTSFAPTSGQAGASIVITGTGFVSVSSVKFNTTEVGAANFTVDSPTQITAKVPAGAANGAISVTTPGGTGASSGSFTVIGAPTVTSFTPTSGAVGASITVTGTTFTGATAVKFNGVAATTFTVNSATQITVTVPAGASSGVISVTTPAGTGSSSAAFTVIGAPTVTSFTPTSGAIGASVVITGTSLTGATVVKFNATAATTFTVNSATQITATVPVGATTGGISVTTSAGTGASANSFTVIAPPTVTSFTPTSGAIGQTVVITGTSFTSATGVKFNGTSATTFTVNSATQITATIPSGATTGTIAVVNPAGTGTSSTTFTVAAAPTVTSFTPTSGIIGATITINGTNFVNVSSVKFNGTESGLANIVVGSATQLTAKVPAGTTNGTISVTTPSGTGTSAGSFTVIVAPTITNFTPTTGIAGTSVVITGTSFTTASSVKFNGTSATFTINTTTQITASVPGGATTGMISVTNPAGTATSAGTFTVIQPPLISSISPVTGTPGTTLTITGSNLANATSVKFSATTVTSLLSNTNTQIQVTVPALGAGAVNVSVVTIAGTSNTKTFTVVPAPVITDLKPNVSYKGFPIMILGSNLAGTIGVKIGSYDATIMTAYDATLMVTIPGSVPNGTYTVTASNDGGPSNGLTLNVITAPGSVGSPPSGTFISPPPADYLNAVSNFWLNAADETPAFFLSTPGTTCQIENPDYASGTNPTDQYVCGSYVFTKDGTGKVTGNYIQLTIGYGHPATNLETFYGQWSATAVDNCFQKLVMISSKDGHVLIAHVQVDFSGTCTP